MKLERINDVLMLNLGNGLYISFRDEWVQELKLLSIEQFGDFIRDRIYPTLSDIEKKTWNQSTISNRDLLNAVQVF